MAFNGFIIFSIVYIFFYYFGHNFTVLLSCCVVCCCILQYYTHTCSFKTSFSKSVSDVFPIWFRLPEYLCLFHFFFIVYVLPECINCGFFMSPIMVLIFLSWKIFTSFLISFRDRRDRDRMVVGFTTA